jgi:hypothetical protein
MIPELKRDLSKVSTNIKFNQFLNGNIDQDSLRKNDLKYLSKLNKINVKTNTFQHINLRSNNIISLIQNNHGKILLNK